MSGTTLNLAKALDLLGAHYNAFQSALAASQETGHPVPSDTRAWSQILVSLLTGKLGLKRKKGADLSDGSDVKGASTWEAIDTPRFNEVIKAGTKAKKAGKLESLNDTPNLFFVLWDIAPTGGRYRCRIWCIRPQKDPLFRDMASKWYRQRAEGKIKSDNFQLQPPRNIDSDTFRNKCGIFDYPLLFAAEVVEGCYRLTTYNPELIKSGLVKKTT